MYNILPTSVLGKPLVQQKHYHIIGGGIAGMLMGFFLHQKKLPFTIYEKNNTLGGLLQTYHTTAGIAEAAANGFLWNTEIEYIAKTIQLPILSPLPENKKRFIVRNGALHRFPLQFNETLKVLINTFKINKHPFNTVADFSNSCLSETFTNQLLEPALQGIYAAKANQLSFAAVLPKIAQATQHHKQLGIALLLQAFNKAKHPVAPKHLKGVLSFKNGMGSFVTELQAYLYKHTVLNTNGIDVLKTLNYPKNQTIIVCTPAHEAATLLKNINGLQNLIPLLQQVQYLPIISVTMFFNKQSLPNFKPGFGCLIPSNENFISSGILFNSCIFNYRTNNSDLISLTSIICNPPLPYFNLLNTELIKLIFADYKKLFNAQELPLQYKIFNWQQGIPLYSPQLYTNWTQIHQLLNHSEYNLNLFGNYTGQISLRGMSEQAAAAVKAIT